ncbi:MAG: Acetolactate synthase isozyme 3 small subunit [Candidatus Omnitrophica bacterium]|nr:Acetolactate synthase isozyme 3 small subunit [Candidatus Omnitrophota bacterium]
MAQHDPTPIQERILSVLVENRSGVLSHVVGLFSARGFNIDSLAVGETEDATISRITLVSHGDARTIEQIKKQLNKLIDVIKVQDLTEEEFIDRELMLVKLRNQPAVRKSVDELARQFSLSIVDDGPKIFTLVCTETRENRKKLFEALRQLGIVEIAQTGAVALSKKTKD